MTFTEAALEVLRTAGEPLHYKKITELAIERNLLSHVGKTPEVTMSSRLAMMVKKDRGQAPIIKVKPGVFAIRESALQGATLSPEALAAISEVEGIEDGKVAVELAPSDEAVSIPPKAPALPGSDVFPEEEGDDDPILAGLEQDSDAGERSGRRRRRRRRRKGDKPEVASELPQRADTAQREPQRERERFRDRPRSERHDRSERSDRNERNDRSERERSDRNDRNDRTERGERFERQAQGGRGAEDRRSEERADETNSLDWNRQPADGDLLGRDLADAVAVVLARGDRSPHTFPRVAELLVRRGRLSGAPAALAPTIAAAVRADIARAELQRSRPRFRLRNGRLSLSEWQLPKGLQRAEQDLLAGAERYANELRRALILKLSELPTAGFAELLATWLNAEGVTALRAVRRPGSSGSELHFAGTRKTGSEEVRLAIVVQRGGRDIDREGVIDVRGALHHYGQAQAAWVVTLGRITSGAREEASAQAAACALFDGNALASAMERLGVAMRRNTIAHHEIDYDLLESLGDNPEQRERREREQERERRGQTDRGRGQQRGRGGRHAEGGQAGQGDRVARGARGGQEGQDNEANGDNADGLPLRAAAPVKLRDADWDDDASEHEVDSELGAAGQDAGAARQSGRGEGDEALSSDDDGQSMRLRDELETADGEAVDEEAAHEDSDEDVNASEGDFESDASPEDSDDDDSDEDADEDADEDSDDDSDDDSDEDADEDSDDEDTDEDSDDEDTDEDSDDEDADEDSDDEDADEDSDDEDADEDSDDEDADEDSDDEEVADDAEKERPRRR